MALTQKAVSQQMVPEVTEGVPHTFFFLPGIHFLLLVAGPILFRVNSTPFLL